MVIFDYVVLFSCRGVPRGPHNPLELLGVQGIGLETKAKERDKNYPFCQKQGICNLLNGVILAPHSKIQILKRRSLIKGKKGSIMKRRERRKLWTTHLSHLPLIHHLHFPKYPSSHISLPFHFPSHYLHFHFGQTPPYTIKISS